MRSDDERRALLSAFEHLYHQDAASLIPAVVGASRREVLLAQLQTAPTFLESGSSALAGLGGEAVETGIEYRASVLRLAIDSRLVGVAEDDVRRAFSGLDASQARTLAAQPLRSSEPGGRTLGDELGQWYRAGGGGRFTLELQQMLDGDAAATRDQQQLIDEVQAQYALESTGPLIGVNDAIQRLFGNDARTVLDADAARLQAAEAALRGSPSAVEPGRADMAVAYMDTGLYDYRIAKDATTEAAKTVATTAAVVGTTVATAGTAAAVWAPVVAGAAANVAASQLNGASNSWQDDAIAVVEGAASGLTLPGSAVTVRGGQYLVREAAEEGGRQVFRSVSRSVAQEAVERGLAEGAEEVLTRGGQVILRDAGRELTIQAFRPTLARAIGQNVAEGVAGSIVGDLSAGALRGEVNPQQVATNAVLAAGTAGLFGLGLAGASRLTETLGGGGANLPAVSVTSLPDQVIPVDRDIIEVRSLMARTDPSSFVRAGLRPSLSSRTRSTWSSRASTATTPSRASRSSWRGWATTWSSCRVASSSRHSARATRSARRPWSGPPRLSLPSIRELAAAIVRGGRPERRRAPSGGRCRSPGGRRRIRRPRTWRRDGRSVDTAPVGGAGGCSAGRGRATAARGAGSAPRATGARPPARRYSLAGRNWVFRALGYMGKDIDQLVEHVAATKMDTVLNPPGDLAGQWWKNSAKVEGPSGAKARLTVVWQKNPADDGVRVHRVWAEMLEAPTPPPEAANATMQAAIVDGMRQTGVSDLAVRSSNREARVWYGVGGGTHP